MFDLTDKAGLAQELNGIIPPIRDRRKPILEKWLNIHAAWQNNQTRTFISGGTFHNKIPQLRRAIEKFSIRGAQMVLPTSEFFEVFPFDGEDEVQGKRAEAVLHYMLYLLRKKIRIYSVVKQLFRTYSLYQRAILKTGVKVVTEDGRERVWPTIRAIDPFLWFYWPETSTSMDEAQIVVEDAFIPVDQYKLEVANGRADEIKPEDICAPTWPDDIIRRLSLNYLTPPDNQGSPVDPKSKYPVGEWLFRSEVWIRQGSGWSFVWLIWNLKGGPRIVRVSKKRYPRPTYRMTIAREIPSEQYTSSMGDDLENISTLYNDQINTFMDAQAISAFGPVAVDNALVQRRGSLVYGPRKIWLVPPEGVKPITTHGDTIARSALQGITLSSALLDSFSGSSALAEGNTVRNMPRAGFAVSSLLSMSLSDIRDAARSIEEDILTPMLPDLLALSVEFIPKSQLIRIPKTGDYVGGSLYVKDLEGDFDLNWVGSLQLQDYQQRATRAMEFLKNIGPIFPQVQAELQARGKSINLVALFKQLWRYGLGEQGADSLVTDIPEGQTMSPSVALALQGTGSGGLLKTLAEQGGGGMRGEGGNE